jgi:hypothetical protein
MKVRYRMWPLAWPISIHGSHGPMRVHVPVLGTDVSAGSSRSAMRQVRWKISLRRDTGPEDSRGQSAAFIGLGNAACSSNTWNAWPSMKVHGGLNGRSTSYPSKSWRTIGATVALTIRLWIGLTSHCSPVSGLVQLSMNSSVYDAEALDPAEHLQRPVVDDGEDVAAEPAGGLLRRAASVRAIRSVA